MSREKKSRTPLRGFGSLWNTDPGRAFKIASAGGRAAHAQGTAHEYTRAEAIVAGRKGGLASQAARRARKEAVEQS